jgi:hypothetical protein
MTVAPMIWMDRRAKSDNASASSVTALRTFTSDPSRMETRTYFLNKEPTWNHDHRTANPPPALDEDAPDRRAPSRHRGSGR